MNETFDQESLMDISMNTSTRKEGKRMGKNISMVEGFLDAADSVEA